MQVPYCISGWIINRNNDLSGCTGTISVFNWCFSESNGNSAGSRITLCLAQLTETHCVLLYPSVEIKLNKRINDQFFAAAIDGKNLVSSPENAVTSVEILCDHHLHSIIGSISPHNFMLSGNILPKRAVSCIFIPGFGWTNRGVSAIDLRF